MRPLRADDLDVLLTAMLDRGLRPVTLSVFALNAPARRFYERFGFRQWDDHDQALNLGYRLE
jgi:RimJ/RimL family protein N-acetyltransferase